MAWATVRDRDGTIRSVGNKNRGLEAFKKAMGKVKPETDQGDIKRSPKTEVAIERWHKAQKNLKGPLKVFKTKGSRGREIIYPDKTSEYQFEYSTRDLYQIAKRIAKKKKKIKTIGSV